MIEKSVRIMRNHLNQIWVCVFLAGAVFLVFGPTLGYPFINFDDDRYVFQNEQVVHGLTLKGVASAFHRAGSDNWTPLTTISHMLDCQWFGLAAGGHHGINVFLHALAAVLLFLAVNRMTGAFWRSAFVAAVFAIHPLRVESVAWVSERKDVLSGVFFMLTLLAYFAYVKKPASLVRYAMVALVFSLGLLSKPMLVTLPCVLLLLDYWPLNRFALIRPLGLFSVRSGKVAVPVSLVLEKVPLLLLAVLACVPTLNVERTDMQSFAAVPLSLRIGNALVSYVVYLGQMFYPANLTAYYPFPTQGIPLVEIILAAAFLIGVSLCVFFYRRKLPCLLVGWFWYLGMLVPVIGIVQVGGQAQADRYTYLPQIGLTFALTWAIVEFSNRWKGRRCFFLFGAILILSSLIVIARKQVAYWRDDETLWTRTLECTTHNSLAHHNLGIALGKQGRNDEAIAQLQQALAIWPGFADAYDNLGVLMIRQGRTDEATVQFQRALTVQPEDAAADYNLGKIFYLQNQVATAITYFKKTVELDPGHTRAHYNLGVACLHEKRRDEALVQFKQVADDNPDAAEMLNNLAWLLATSPDPSLRDGTCAVQLAEHACALTHFQKTIFVGTLAAAYAEAGRFDEAVATAQKACALAETAGETSLLGRNQELLSLYRGHQPCRDETENKLPLWP